MGARDRKRHQLRGLVAGEADHHALVASPDAVISINQLPGADLDGMLDAAQDLRALVLDCDDDAACRRVEAVQRVRVPNASNGLAHDSWDVDVGRSRDLAK